MSYLRHAILPELGALRVDAVSRADVARRFDEYGRERPGDANGAHDIPREMFAHTVSWGHRPEAAGNCSVSASRAIAASTRQVAK